MAAWGRGIASEPVGTSCITYSGQKEVFISVGQDWTRLFSKYQTEILGVL